MVRLSTYGVKLYDNILTGRFSSPYDAPTTERAQGEAEMETMTAFVLHGKKDLRRESRPVPRAQPDSVLIRVVRAGVCGSDMHYYHDWRVGDLVPRMPFVLGHEFAGEIVQCGKNVDGFRPADRVIVEPAIPCRFCSACRQGRYNLCRNMKVVGSASSMPHLDGGFAEYVAVPAHACFPLPAGLGFQEGALVEPLAVAVQSTRRAGVLTGKTILITGAGAIGQTILVMARAMGAARVALTDVDPFAREFSLSRGADAAFDPIAEGFGEESRTFAPEGFDVVFEASGTSPAAKQALELARKGGTVVQVGLLPASVSLNFGLITTKELQVFGSFRYANAFEIALDLLTNGRVQINGLVSHVFAFGDTQRALDCAIEDPRAMKVHIEH
jgi:2-desacetyl-2-hydroxyethyl bacteriochlorophyllide A dehydrogenase